jgi:hopene-associated glycosyltransferase HpnB
MSSKLARIISLLMVGSWTGLLVARGRFWDPPVDRLRAPLETNDANGAPAVHVVVPARNEASILPSTLPTLFAQEYAGRLGFTLADDNSDDGTAARAHWLATEGGAAQVFSVTSVPPRPAGWAGKVWALAAGVEAARKAGHEPIYWLFTDADIAHDPTNIAALVATARADRRDLVSLMVQLRCASPWERLLIPAFVFFFAKLYPFAWVADDRRATAAAAGGCVLISDHFLRTIGGIERIANALIDDCALAAAVKSHGGRLRLELSTRARSLRPYDSLDTLWDMVARSAYTQLHESPALLAGTVAGMLFLYGLPLFAFTIGLVRRNWTLSVSGAVTWAIMTAMYQPILRRYAQPAGAALLLPLAAALYTLMTIDSAQRHWRGEGAAWKGRVRDARPPTRTALQELDPSPPRA